MNKVNNVYGSLTNLYVNLPKSNISPIPDKIMYCYWLCGTPNCPIFGNVYLNFVPSGAVVYGY